MHNPKCCHTFNVSARHSALLSHVLVVTDSAQTSRLLNVEYDKRKQSENTAEAPELLYTKLSCLWRSWCHREVSCWMASVHSYDTLWYNLAKTTTGNQLELLFSSTNHASDEGIYAQALTDVQWLHSQFHFCRFEAITPNEGWNVTEIQPLPSNLPTDWTWMTSPQCKGVG